MYKSNNLPAICAHWRAKHTTDQHTRHFLTPSSLDFLCTAGLRFLVRAMSVLLIWIEEVRYTSDLPLMYYMWSPASLYREVKWYCLVILCSETCGGASQEVVIYFIHRSQEAVMIYFYHVL